MATTAAARAAVRAGADDRDEGAAVPVERVVGQVRHAIGQHCVPVGDDDPPAAHVQNRGAGLRSAIHGAERPLLWTTLLL